MSPSEPVPNFQNLRQLSGTTLLVNETVGVAMFCHLSQSKFGGIGSGFGQLVNPSRALVDAYERAARP